jgi:hypothetical protein
MLLAFAAMAADITLAWDPNDEPDLKGYNIYFKNHVNEDYRLMAELFEDDLLNPLVPTIQIFSLSDSLVYYFVATAFSETLESEHSNEVIWKAPAKPEPDDNTDNGDGSGGCFISTIQ